jgi:hypothetical protein
MTHRVSIQGNFKMEVEIFISSIIALIISIFNNIKNSTQKYKL